MNPKAPDARRDAPSRKDAKTRTRAQAGKKPSRPKREKSAASAATVTDDGWETVPTSGAVRRPAAAASDKREKKAAAAPPSGGGGAFGAFASLQSDKKKRKKDGTRRPGGTVLKRGRGCRKKAAPRPGERMRVSRGRARRPADDRSATRPFERSPPA